MKIKKQSLMDWAIEDDNGKHLGWIQKINNKRHSIGPNYLVTKSSNCTPFFFSYFSEAKNFAKEYV